MTSKMIPVAGPWITEREISYVTDAVTRGWYEHANDYVTRFEESFAAYTNRKHAISLPTCTSAIHLSLAALNIGPGDEVIIPDATWIASAAPIQYVGATPIFADIEPQTWCLSTKSVRSLLTRRTKAIIAVNLYGHMPDYDELCKLGVPVIEDAAESIGSKYRNKPSGSFGITSCFSFHGSKTLTTGEGGMLLTDDEKIFARCAVLRDHGRLPGDTLFQNVEVAYKYKMSNLQAALGLAQLERIEELVSRKRDLFLKYKEAFSDLDFIRLNPESPDLFNSYWMVTAQFSEKIKLTKFEIIAALAEKKISTRPFFQPLSSLKAYSEASDQSRAARSNLNAYQISSRSINLPSAACLDATHVDRIRECILSLR